ncbi:MAG: transcriptional regulator, GntR family with sensor domain [Actinomycetia bacterium]|nr:transcriptional regulator, GntR family with sensor domain [Actinomycetes bacterium]
MTAQALPGTRSRRERNKTLPDRTEFVYLIGSEESPFVKIGRSVDVQGRLAAIQRMSPAKLTVLWQTLGGAELETALHRRFSAFRSHGEWFDFPGRDAPEQVVRAITEITAEAQRLRAEQRRVRKTRKARKVWKAPRGPQARKVRPRSRLAAPSVVIEKPRSHYQQVTDILRKQIESGVYPSGSLLPSEPEIADRLGVTRPTVNRALAILRTEGLVQPRRGVGTTVTLKPRRRRVRDLVNNPTTCRERICTRVPDFDEARALNIDDDQRIFAITRTTRAAEGRAMEVTELMPAHQWELYAEWDAE